jgi:hypothetical protein
MYSQEKHQTGKMIWNYFFLNIFGRWWWLVLVHSFHFFVAYHAFALIFLLGTWSWYVPKKLKYELALSPLDMWIVIEILDSSFDQIFNISI